MSTESQASKGIAKGSQLSMKDDESKDQREADRWSRFSRRRLRLYLGIVLFFYVSVVHVLPRVSLAFDALTYIGSSSTAIIKPLDQLTDYLDVETASASISVQATAQDSRPPRRKAPLEAHIMSKCPDARDCLRDLIVPAMEQIADEVDFRLSYIGNHAPDDTIVCKHGPGECLGNILGLCAVEMFPGNLERSLGFSNCLVHSYAEIPARSLVEHCALEHGIDFEQLNSCASADGHGLDLLEASVNRSQEAGVVKSCTVRVDQKIWCIRDGGEWKDCPFGSSVADLVKAIRNVDP